MEADLQRVYQVDLVDLWRPRTRLTLRKLAVLVRLLPEDALTWRVTGHRRLTWMENATARLLEVHTEQDSPDRPGPPFDPAKASTAAPSKDRAAERAERLAEHAARYKDRPRPRKR